MLNMFLILQLQVSKVNSDLLQIANSSEKRRV